MTTIQHRLPYRQAPQACGEHHDWDYRGYCEDCGTPQPDYDGPDDTNMPGLAHNTDTPDTTTYPWNQEGPHHEQA